MKLIVFVLAALWLCATAGAGCMGGCETQSSPPTETEWSGDAKAPTRLILATPSHSYGGPIWAAIEIDIADGWYVYADGEGGDAAFRLQWGGSANLAPVVRRWPASQRIEIDGKPARVYAGTVVLPVSIAPLQTEQDIRLGLTITYAVCGAVCRPGYAVHRVVVSAAPRHVTAAAAANAARIAEALAAAKE